MISSVAKFLTRGFSQQQHFLLKVDKAKLFSQLAASLSAFYVHFFSWPVRCQPDHLLIAN